MGHALMRYLVTGAQGFLGAQLVHTLRTVGAEVTATGRRSAENVYCCDLTDASAVARMMDEVFPDCVIHCAAYVPKTIKAYQDIDGANAGYRMLDNLLNGSDCPVVFVSSMTVYGAAREQPVVEEDAGNPVSAYGEGKWQAELRLKADGRPSLAVRIPGLFGPARRGGLVHNVVSALKHGHPDPQLPESAVLWAAMHVEDAAECIVKLASAPMHNHEAVHIGYRGAYSIDRFVALACEIFGGHIDYVVEQPRFEFNLSRAESRDAVPTNSFRDALEKFGAQL
jgi:nucleoside-diphosphate-sugar epimerase